MELVSSQLITSEGTKRRPGAVWCLIFRTGFTVNVFPDIKDGAFSFFSAEIKAGFKLLDGIYSAKCANMKWWNTMLKTLQWNKNPLNYVFISRTTYKIADYDVKASPPCTSQKGFGLDQKDAPESKTLLLGADISIIFISYNIGSSHLLYLYIIIIHIRTESSDFF